MSRRSSPSGNGQASDERQSSVKHRLGQRGGTARRSSAGDGATSSWSRHGTALPGWTDLERPTNRRRRERTSEESFFERISTVRFALAVLVLAGAFTLYVGHVHATRDLLNEVQELRSENKRLHLKRNRLKGQFARKTSPSVIYERARELGLRASVTYGPPVSIEE
jgi:cell division protein FtsL